METRAGKRERGEWVPGLDLGWRELQVGVLFLGGQEVKLRRSSPGEAWRLGN